ncbi:chaperonin 10-like protein [Mycena galericulata]|nr:chaperonin 10-like protein [Mycena galericulata]
MSQQQALVIPYRKASFLLTARGIPSPGKGEVLLKILSIGLNPVNWVQHDFDMAIYEYPAVIGTDVAGVVKEIGEDVEGFGPGDEVFAQAPGGGFRQYTTLPAAILIRKPKNVSFDEVATFPVTFTTACVGLFAPAPIGLGLNPTFSWDKPQQGESALVIGAGTSVGQFAIQLFKFLGCTRIVAYASNTHFTYLRQLGATECIDRNVVSIERLVVTPAVRVVFDATPGALGAAYACVADGGGVVVVRPQAVCDTDDPQAAGRGVALVRCFGFYAGAEVAKPPGAPHQYPALPAHTQFGRHIIRELPVMLERGVVVANRVEILRDGLAGIPGGLERMKAGVVKGVKLVAHPQDTTV